MTDSIPIRPVQKTIAIYVIVGVGVLIALRWWNLEVQKATLVLRPLALVSSNRPPNTQGASMIESTLLQYARHYTVPAYSPELIDRHVQGVAVVEVLISDKGDVKSLRMVQAPDPVIAASVEQAVRQWTFAPLMWDTSTKATFPWDPSGKYSHDSIPLWYSGKLTFYYKLDGSRAVVENPFAFGRN